MKTGTCLSVLLALAAPVLAQTADTLYFRAVLLPANEVPAINSTNRGTADVVAHVIRDSAGQIVSGTVNVVTHLNLTAAVAVTGMDIWKGSTGQNGSMVLSTGYSSKNAPIVQNGGDLVQGPALVPATNTAALTALRDLAQNPAGYYLNVQTATSPTGAIRGQLQKAQGTVLLALLTTANMNPLPPVQGFGVAKVVAIATRDAANNLTSGEILFSASYSSGDGSAFSSLQIHQGNTLPTTAGAIAATLPGGLMPDPTGTGVFGPFYTEITTTTATQANAFNQLFFNPASLYIDLHTLGNPSGLMLAPLRRTDAMVFPLKLSSTNVPTATSVTAAAAANLTLYTVRDVNGDILAGTFLSDIDYGFPGSTQFISTDLHVGSAGQTGPVAIHLAGDFHDDNGTGNFYDFTPPVQDAELLNKLVAHPEQFYVSMHTTDDPAGAVRAQLAPVPAGKPTIGAALTAALDVSTTTLAPGELFSVFGTNLVNVATDLSGWVGTTLPNSLNSLTVSVGGRRAALVFVSPGQVNAQIPLDTPPGQQSVVISSANGVSTGFNVTVAAVAPSIFFSPLPAVVKNVDFSLVTTANPAKPGDPILVYCTGLGQTDPAQSTGVISTAIANTALVTASMGGKPATVIYSIASPSFPGLYQVAITVPAGLTGPVPLVLQQGGAASNTVTVALR